MSPTSLHKQTGISRDAFYRLQNGRGFPALETLVAFADVVGTTAARLLDGVMPPTRSVATPPGVSPPTLSDRDRLRQIEDELVDLRTAASRLSRIDRVLGVLLSAPSLPETLRDQMQKALEPTAQGQS